MNKYEEALEFLNKLDAEILKIELLCFLEDNEETEVESKEDFVEKFVEYIEEDFSYGDL